MELNQLKTRAKQNANYAVRAATVLTVAALSLGAVNAEPVGAHGTFVARTDSLNPSPLETAPLAPVVKEEIVTEEAPQAPQTVSQAPSRRSGGGGCGLDVIKQRESGGRYTAVSGSGKYRGAYQFDQHTWQSVGGSGDPAAASPGEQDSRAAALYAQRGSAPWSTCH